MDESAFQSALDLHRAGKLPEAEATYRGILATDPDDVDVIHLLGVLAKQTGRDDEALKLIEHAIELDPEYAEAHFNLGNILAGRGSLDRAIACYQKAIELQPDYSEAKFNLGDALLKAGRIDDAIASLKSAIHSKPQYVAAHSLLGTAFAAKGDNAESIAAYQRAIELMPNFAEAYNNVGQPLKKVGRLDDALAAFRRAIQLKPDFAEAHSNLSGVLADKGDLDGAIAACRRAIELMPDYAEAHFNLGNSLLVANKLDEAIASYRRAIQIKPDYAEALDNLGNALNIAGQPDAAIEYFKRAIALQPAMAKAFSSLANALKDKGQIAEAIQNNRRAVALAPENARLHSSLIYGLQFDPDCAPADLLAEERNWARRHADPLKGQWPAHSNNRDPNRRLKVGYISGDFRAHPVGRFMVPLLAHHDHQNFEIFCYSSVRAPDELTARTRRAADVWRDIAPLSDEQGAKSVEADQIDILVDLTMHSAKDRLLLLARKPAPIEVTYLAYPGSTGMDAVDYRITDPYLDPPGAPLDYYTEQSIRLPKTYWCYEPLLESEPGPLPAAKNGFITFGCLNNFCKASPAALATWANLLSKVPNSRLILHSNEGAHRAGVQQVFERAGVGAARIEFVGKMSVAAYMDCYHAIDIALDPFPYVGGTTTCDALWMGVPVITLAGRTALERGGVSILTNSGLTELIAKTPAEYIEIAAALALDVNRLAGLRQAIRPQMRQSPIMDAKQFALDMENAYRQIWQRWCTEKRG